MPDLRSFPFGDPDGARADLDGFVEFCDPPVWGGLALREDDLSARVIVGRKGSGKTIYLRRLKRHATESQQLYARDIEGQAPSSLSIIKFCDGVPEKKLTALWLDIWRKAVLRSLVSILSYDSSISSLVPHQTIYKLREYEHYRPLLRRITAPLTIYSQVAEIIYTYDRIHKLERFLADPHWYELESDVSDLLKRCPPICLYLDAIDEEFESAPLYWLQCQLGLFYQVIRLLRDQAFGGRLHITICIRDLILASVLQSEHKTRFAGDHYVHILNWDVEAIRHFLRKKLEILDNQFFTGEVAKGKTTESWLGLKEIHNLGRQIEEPVEDYLLRHTRFLPRDIVILGNKLCGAIQQNKRTGKLAIEDVIRRTVSEVAALLGDEQLYICASHIASRSMPKGAAKHGYSELYTSDKSYVDNVKSFLKKLIRQARDDHFSSDVLTQMRQAGSTEFGEYIDVASILWQNGLLGYIRQTSAGQEHIFFSEKKMDDFALPLDEKEYVFHSCLIDSVGVKATGHKPVMPFA